MHITDRFDGGNIEIVEASNPRDIRLRIRTDSNSDFYQWFYFRASGVVGEDCVFRIVNAGTASYPKGWEGYRACASYDRETWFRVPTDFVNGTLTIRLRPETDTVWIAYFAPYAYDRHLDLISRSLATGLRYGNANGGRPVRHEVLGTTIDLAPMDLLVFGIPSAGRRSVWFIGRQHPGETQASWWMEGMIGRMLDPGDRIVDSILDRAVVHVVPLMNPDGARRGNLRTNAAGANLNREWLAPSPDRSPEVLCVRAKMMQTGVDVCMDVHGDEALPYVFIAGAEGIPSLSERQVHDRAIFDDALMRTNSDFQTKYGYPQTPPGKANLTICTSWVAETFGALSMTLEMPFKDNANIPDVQFGWSPERCRHLGAACLDALNAVLIEGR